MNKLPKYLTVRQSDGSICGVPVEMIARNRAKYYASKFGGDIERSLLKGTLPLFADDSFAIEDWAVNNIDWNYFDGHQVQLSPPEPVDFREGWLSGEKGLQ